MKVLFLESFYGGSHRLFADAVARLSRHDVRLVTLPSSFWKWRMRGGHLSFAGRIAELKEDYHCLLTSDMVSLAELKGTCPAVASLPAVVYFHENQLSYPVPKGEAPDVHFGFTNISTALAAEKLVFNSEFHREEFLKGFDGFLKVMPDHRPGKLEDRLRGKSAVVYPGVDSRVLEGHRRERESAVTTILWNHRWEFDKRPEIFFASLAVLADEGCDFKVHVLGENFQVKPKPFLEARERLGARIGIFGFRKEREEYLRALWDSDIVVSTAIQEFYGIAVMEAVCCGCRPLVPRRLVYPELYGEEYLYDGDKELTDRLRLLLKKGGRGSHVDEPHRKRLAGMHDVGRSVARLDDLMEETAAGKS